MTAPLQPPTRPRRTRGEPPVVRAVYRPRPGAFDRFLDVLVELLDEQRRSERG